MEIMTEYEGFRKRGMEVPEEALEAICKLGNDSDLMEIMDY